MSNPQTWAETFAPILSKYKHDVYETTWGHLTPLKNKKYNCKILFSSSSYGNAGLALIQTILGTGLNDSPWLYNSMNGLIESLEIQGCGVFEWNGFFRNYTWHGEVKLVYSI